MLEAHYTKNVSHFSMLTTKNAVVHQFCEILEVCTEVAPRFILYETECQSLHGGTGCGPFTCMFSMIQRPVDRLGHGGNRSIGYQYK